MTRGHTGHFLDVLHDLNDCSVFGSFDLVGRLTMLDQKPQDHRCLVCLPAVRARSTSVSDLVLDFQVGRGKNDAIDVTHAYNVL